MRRIICVCILGWTVLQAGEAAAQIDHWINAHPKVAYSLRWQYKTGGSYYDISEDNKIAWPDWTSAQQQDLIDAYDAASTWYHSADPYDNLDETIAYPPANQCDGADGDAPRTCVADAYAWDMYLRWAALNLVIEIEGVVPWSITEYDTDTLKLLLDSTSIMTKNDNGTYDVGTEIPGHGAYLMRRSNLGASLIAPPRYTLAFLAENDLIGTDRLDTIERVLQWASENLSHFLGGYEYGGMAAQWQYRGLPPITRIIEGTNNELWENYFSHWTAGCHGTTGFFRNVLRAVNIPMRIATVCGHSQAEFVTEGLYLDHGDDVYNSDFKGSGYPVGDLLIDEMTYLMWFGPDPYNHDYDAFCEPTHRIGDRIYVLTGDVEDCLDGVDNDGDGLIDCADDDCEPISVFTQTKLVASNNAADDHLGAAADLDGNTAVIGAYARDGVGDDSGAAYVFTYQNGEGWLEEAELLPQDTEPGENFGFAVAVDGDTAVVGSDVPDGFAGHVWVFQRNGGVWTEAQGPVPAGVVAGDRFGISTAIEGDLLAVGAFGDDSYTGAVYLFRREGASWIQEDVLTASDGGAGDVFGYDVQISGDAVIVGAYQETGGDLEGAAYVYRYNNGTWIEEAKLTAPDPAAYQYFGWTVDISGDVAVVGAMYDSEAAALAGAAYVYQYDGNSWSFDTKLKASDAWASDFFGVSVSIEDGLLVVGAYGDHHIGPIKSPLYPPEENVGAAYVFSNAGGTWSEIRKLTADDGVGNDRFGYVVPISGTRVLVGAYGDDDAGDLTGSAYIFDLGETATGQCLSIQPVGEGGAQPATLRFSQIVEAGDTALTLSDDGPPPPDGYLLGTPPTYFDITTTADFEGGANLCIDYSDIAFNNESAIGLLFFEAGTWTDLCEASVGSCVADAEANTICADIDALGVFAIAEKSTLFDNVTLPHGHASTDAVFMAEDLPAVGTLALIDVFIPATQPNPSWVGQIQMTANIPSAGVNSANMGTVQLTGLPLGQWSTLTFNVPQSVRNTLLTGIAGAFFRIISDTPSNALPLVVNNFRFGGTITARSASAPSRGTLDELFSFESASVWTPSGAVVASNTTYVTDGVKSLRLQRSTTNASVSCADFLTDELTSVGNALTVDLRNNATFSWGQLQANLDCSTGQVTYLGQQTLTGLSAGAFHTLSIPLPSAARTVLSNPGSICRIQLVVNAPSTPVIHLDNLDIR